MFLRANDLNPAAYDAIVMGSGPAGATVAFRLSSLGKRALIIETGTLDYDADLQADFSSMSGHGHFDGDHWARHWVRAFGGTSWVWNGWCIPLTDRNFADWPISRRDLDPYYREAAKILRLPPDFLTYSSRSYPGFDYRPFLDEPPLRFGDPETNLFNDDPNVDVLLGSTVTELLAREDRTALTGLKLWQQETGVQEILLREDQMVVLAAGGIGNAQILLASEPGHGAAIGNEADQVGRYLMEHPHIYDCARLIVPASQELPSVPRDFGSHVPAIVPDDETFSEIGGLDVSIELDRTELDDDDPVELFLHKRLGGASRVYQLTVRSEMRADPANRVQIAAGQDPSGLPRMQTWCVIESEALRAADQCLRVLGQRIAESGLGRLRILNEKIYREAYGGGHTMGTTRMGTDPRNSVVDRNCRVHGYRNLYVAGSSVFTTGGYANPTLTIVALAARLGDHLGGAG